MGMVDFEETALSAVSGAIAYGLIGCELDFFIQRRRIQNWKLPNEPTEGTASANES
jgi:hypothetical protein